MTENEWTSSICELLTHPILGENFHATTLQKIPYALEISSFSENWEAQDDFAPTKFETDLCIYEKVGDRIKPRVIIESKIGRISSHDVITYSYKAECHKNVIPYLRYGIMFGDRDTYPLPGRAFRHGTHFDFLFSFVGLTPTELEKNTFLEILKKEVVYSQQIEEILSNSRSRNRKRYFALQKEFHLIEME